MRFRGLLVGCLMGCHLVLFSALGPEATAAQKKKKANNKKSSNNNNKNSSRNSRKNRNNDRRLREQQQRVLRAQAAATARAIAQQLKSLEKQLAGAKQRLKAAQAQMTALRPSLDKARADLSAIKDSLRSTEKEQRQVEAEIEGRQPESSHFGKASLALKQAQANYTAAEKRIATKLNKPVASEEVIAAKRRDLEFDATRRMVRTTHEALNKIRAKLFENSSEWVAVNKDNQRNRDEMSSAQQTLDRVVGQYNRHAREALTAQRIVSRATATRSALQRRRKSAESASRSGNRNNQQRNRSNKNRKKPTKKKKKKR